MTLLAKLEKDLRELWIPAPGTKPKARACMMNLVTVSAAEISERYISIIDEVTKSIPSRAIVVGLDPASPRNELLGDVTAVGSGADNTTSSERVHLVANGTACTRVASAIGTLLLPEIPTTLVWLNPVRTDDPVFIELAEGAERVVLDTEYTSVDNLLDLARWSREEHGRPGIADLAWTRLAPWQEMCARFFDDPRVSEVASQMDALTLTQASEPGAPMGSECALLCGWFATRLGWKIVGRKLLRPDGVAVAVKIKSAPRPEPVAPLALMGVAVECAVENLVLRAVVERDLESSETMDVLRWKLDVNVPSATEQKVRLGPNKGGRLLERTLRRSAHDPALIESALFARELSKLGWKVT